jgi:predicted nucleic acid-binding protein
LNVYVDSSVLLRVILGERGQLPIWSEITTGISSELIRLECLRTIDRARIRIGLDDARLARYRADVLDAVDSLRLIALDSAVLVRAADPFPTLLGSLDAIHLASALLMRDEVEDLVFATHDDELGVAAHSMGFDVQGVNLPR